MVIKKIFIALFMIGIVFVPFMETLGGDVSHPQKINLLNSPPTRPVLDGPASGETGTSYTYTATSTDPDGDNIIYCFDWGDGSNEFCTTPFPSGQTASVTHTWASDGTYTITCKASDPSGAESEPATLRVSMPKNKDKNEINIMKPKNGLYIHGTKIIPLIGQVIIGDIDIMIRASDDIEKVEFRLNHGHEIESKMNCVDTTPPFSWDINSNNLLHGVLNIRIIQITAVGYDINGETVADKITILQI